MPSRCACSTALRHRTHHSQFGCWGGDSGYPKGLFNAHSCAWLNCRKHMVSSMHGKFCGPKSLPDHRTCVVDGWCQQLAVQMGIEKAPPPPAPPVLVPKLNGGEIAGIVVGSLAATLIVFSSGFVIGWLRQKFTAYRNNQADGAASGVEFARLDSLVTGDPEL